MKFLKYILSAAALSIVIVAGYTYTKYKDISYIPMAISVDREWHKSNVFLKVTDENYNLTEEKILKSDEPEDKEIRDLIVSLKNKKVNNIIDTVHSSIQGDESQTLSFVQGAIQYWNKFTAIKVERRFSYSNEKVYIVSSLLKGKIYKVVIRFAYDKNSSSFKYVPYGMDNFANYVISMWARQYPLEPKIYKPQSALSYGMLTKDFGYTLIDNAEKNYQFTAAKLVFDGQDFSKKFIYSEQIKKVYVQMQEALKQNKLDEFLSFHTDLSAKYLKKSFPTTDNEVYKNFRNTFMSFASSFVINASPVFILYSADTTQGYSINYFFKSQKGDYKLANAGVLPISFQVFNGEQFIKALDDKPPFKSLRTKED